MSRRLKTPSDPAVLAQFREVLRAADFTVSAITGLLGNAEITELKSRSPRMLYRTRSGNTLDTLIRLFVAGVPVPVEQAEAALQPVPVSTLTQIGVLRVASGKAVPLVSILPHDDLVVASDQPFRSGKDADYVPGMLDSSVFLELFAIRRPVTSALDLGTGCGIQALRASLHSDHVTAVDLSPRALDFGRFNAALNGASNIEFLEGSGFEPLTGRRFDLIVANLPFVITPSGRYFYRDSGQKLDGFAHSILTEAPSHLNEGGYCQLLFQWVEVEGQDWHDRLQEWFDGSGCDVWVMKNDSRPPDAYAEKWIADTEPRPAEGVERLYEQWMAFYEAERIVAIHSGAVAMRRRDGNNWIRMDEGPDRARSPFGEAVIRAFAAAGTLQTASDKELLAAKLRISPDIHLIQRCEWSNGEWRPEAVQIRFHRELEYIANIDQFVSKLVARSTGERNVGELIDELAEQTGLSAARLRPACLQLIRGLIERGFLLSKPPEI